MAAFPAMSRLPPVGEPIRMGKGAGTAELLEDPYEVTWLDSGTSALALAMLRACTNWRRGGPKANVIVPGYSCPDLVSAAAFCGVTAKPVDLRPGSFRMDLRQVESAIDSHTVAVVAPHFLGMREDLEGLLDICRGQQISLIEDSSQRFPGQRELRGDHVVFSFNRGKPVTLLGGGALASRRSDRTVEPAIEGNGEPAAIWMAKAMAYNALRHPLLYRWLPLESMGVGATRYQELESLRPMGRGPHQRLSSNIASQWTATRRRREHRVDEYVRSLEGLPLDFIHAGEDKPFMTRLPILLHRRETRDAVFDALHQGQMGATRMYGRILYEIDGMPRAALDPPTEHPLVNARDFAGRLLTLPIHDNVAEHQIEIISRTLSSATANGSSCKETGSWSLRSWNAG